MELRQLAYFVAVAEEEQFTRAAARVSVAQPAISAQIRRLERELGEILLHRGQRSVRLTAAGEVLIPHARAALAAVERARDSVASLRGLLHGRLRVGVSRPADHRLAEALGLFHRAHPGIDITLAEAHNDPLLKALANGDLDAAVVGVGRLPPPPSIRTRVIAAEPLVLGVRHGRPLSHRKTVTLGELRDEPMITLTTGSGLRTLLDDACRGAGFTPRITAETAELGALAELAAEGLGVVILPRSATDNTDLTVLQISRPRLERRTVLAWNPPTATSAGRAFLLIAERHLTGAPTADPTNPTTSTTCGTP